jgi:integrase/recombinase XerD
MDKKVFISISLDKRRAKASGKYPVKLRVFTPSPRKQKLYPTKFEYSEKEFESIWETVKPRDENKKRRNELAAIEKKAADAAEGLSPFTFEQFEKKLYLKKGEAENVFYQYDQIIKQLKSRSQFGTASNYNLSRRSISKFITHTTGKEPVKLHFSEISVDFLEKYERFMMNDCGASFTTVSMYLRALRTIFNNAISEKEIEADLYPFGKKKYQIPATRNVKKALTKDQLKQLFEAQPSTVEQEKAKDFWFFSFTCNGMNIKDIALLKYEHLKNDTLIFLRAKTIRTSKTDLKPVVVYLNEFALNVIKKYGNSDKKESNFIFPILSESEQTAESHNKIKNFTRFINQNLKKLASEKGITGEISTYWARHSFATTAIRKGASMEFVSEALSHNNLKTTQSYFAGFEEEDKKKLMNDIMDF